MLLWPITGAAKGPRGTSTGCWGHVCLSVCSSDGGLPRHGAFQGADLKKSKTQAALKVSALRRFHWVLAGALVPPAKLSHREGGSHRAQPQQPYKDPSPKPLSDPSALSVMRTEMKPSKPTQGRRCPRHLFAHEAQVSVHPEVSLEGGRGGKGLYGFQDLLLHPNV